MFQKAIDQMRGDEVHAHDGRIGALDDLYFDRESWQVRYLVVDVGGGERVLISAGCAAGAAARDRLHVGLSRAQVELGSGAWRVDAATEWLDAARVCSGRTLAGCYVEAVDGTVGLVADLVVDDEAWSIDYLLVAPARAERCGHIMVPQYWVEGVDLERRAVRVRCTREEIHNSPYF